MRLRLTLTLTLTSSKPQPAAESQPQFEHRDIDSMVIHEDQPKYIGFRRADADLVEDTDRARR